MINTGGFRPQAPYSTAAAAQAKFKQGLAFHQQGKLADAERLYREALQQQPTHFDAMHLLGVAAYQSQQPDRAVDLIQRAIRLDRTVAAAHNNLGNALMDL